MKKKALTLVVVFLFLVTLIIPTNAELILDDNTPPVTTCYIDGMIGDNDWFVSDVILTLESTDEGSGVANTFYCLDDGNWNIYSTPVIVEEDGYHIIQFYSVDNAGNVEIIDSFCFKIDQHSPEFWDLEYLNAGDIGPEIIADISDEMSNIYKVEFLIDTYVRYEDYEFPYRWICDEEGILGAIAYDYAGNSAAYDIPIKEFEIQDNDKSSLTLEQVTSKNSDILISGTMGENGWYTSDVTIAFSRANNLYYRLNSGDWILYTSPVTLGDDGWFFFEYFTYTEPVELEIIKIDQTNPLIDNVVQKYVLFQIKWEVRVYTYDKTSNVDRVEFYIDDELKSNETDRPFVQTFHGSDADIKVILYDKAGNLVEDSSITPCFQSELLVNAPFFQFFEWFLIRFPILYNILLNFNSKL